MRGHTPKPVTGHRRAFAALVSTAALAAALTASGPAFAQDQAAPPVAPTVAQPAPAAPVQAVPAPQAAAPAAPTFAAPSPVVQPIDPSKTGPAQITDAASAADAAPARPAARRTAVRQTETRTVRAERPAAVAAPAPKPAAPAPAPAPEAAAPAPVAAAPVVAPAKPAVDTAAKSTTTRQTTTDTPSAPIWPWLVAAGLIVLGIAGFLFSRRRRNDAVYTDDYAEPAYAAPVAVEPVYAAVPAVVDAQMTDPFVETPQPVEADIAVAPTQAELTAPESEDVAALTDAAAPVANRPWLEFAMRPISASTNADEAMVEIELTIGNSGSIAAEDVQISTFMFPAGHADATEMERLLLERGPRDGVTIEPGEGTRLDATLSVLRSSLEGDFQPVIVADARYRLPDGSEGRTAASFSIGLSDGGGISPIPTEDKGRHEDIAAVLYGEPEHA